MTEHWRARARRRASRTFACVAHDAGRIRRLARLARVGAERAESDVAITPRGSATGAPVLVVEDHEDTREMVATLLSFHGFTVITAENGQRGLERLLRERPCLILLDLMMPVMTGWEFRAAQLSLPDSDLAAVPVLLLTAVSEPQRAAKGMASST